MITFSVILPIKIGDPWQVQLAEFAISTMRMHTRQAFELVIVESGSEYFTQHADKHLRIDEGSYSAQWNEAADQASGDYLIHTALDILLAEDWLEALIECFDIPDCGVATLSCTEPGAMVGNRQPLDCIIEGMYGPLMMFRNGLRFDPQFPNLHNDSDLVMRVYEAGQRSYRNNRVICDHLDGVTWKSVTSHTQREQQREYADKLFKQRYSRSPLWMAKMILRGAVIYGREHE